MRTIASEISALSKFSLHLAKKRMTLIGSEQLNFYSPITTRRYCIHLRLVAYTFASTMESVFTRR